MSKINWDNAQENILMLFILASIVAGGFWAFNTLSKPEPDTVCKAVTTSVDYDSDNDVFCLRPDGTTYYTNRGEAEKVDPDF